jgi:hypothetical protein
MKIQSAVLAMIAATALAIASSACTSVAGTPSGTGGSSGAGGAPASCPANVAPCGGNVVGTWNVQSSCLTVSGNLDLTLAGLNCPAPPVSGSLHVTGSFTANADTTDADNTTTTGTEQFTLAPTCLMLSGTTTTCDGITGPIQGGLGFASLSCTNATGGGCNCTATIQQTGGFGLLSPSPSTSGNYATSDNTLTITGDVGDAKYSYCVSGSTLTVTPQSTSASVAGTIVLQKSGGGSGTGGASGIGGTTGTGGNGGRGGSVGTGGRGGAVGTGGVNGTGGATAAGGSSGAGQGPCDIYAGANVPCVAAYSPIRRLASAYTGPLYQVRKAGTMATDGTGANMKTGIRAGGTTQDIPMTADGFGDAAAQDAFCGTDSCTFSIIYDQSGRGNHLRVAPAGCYVDGSANLADFESNAKQKSLMVAGHRVYALYTNTREGYRNNSTSGVQMGNTPQEIYMLADGTHAGTACCWDFGNVGKDNCNGTTMNTLFFGTGFWGRGAGTAGPWFMGDFEGGVWSGGNVGAPSAANNTTATNPSMTGVPYAFGILKTSSGQYALRMANLSGSLMTAYDGASPKGWSNGGGIVLGTGGDNSNHSFGTFFEGALTAGRPSDATDALILQNIQGLGYGR